jgi:hypothetical protein
MATRLRSPREFLLPNRMKKLVRLRINSAL